VRAQRGGTRQMLRRSRRRPPRLPRQLEPCGTLYDVAHLPLSVSRSGIREEGTGNVSASKIAVVTGTSTGIGYATSLHLARHGYRVFAGMRNLDKAEALRTAAAAEGLPVEIMALDVASGDSVDAAFRRVSAEGSIDVLVNNAGISGASPLEL